MSEEPPPLRLKPRQRAESDAPPAEPAAPVAAEPEEGKLRLKPKLVLAPEPEPEPVAEAAAEPAEPEPEPEPASPPPPPMPEEGRGKLKIKLPSAVAQETEAAPVSAEEEVSAELPPFPVVAPPPPDEEIGATPVVPEEIAKPTTAPFRGTIPPGGSRPAVFIRPKVPAALLAAEQRRRMWKYALIALGGVVLAAGVISLALKFTESPPPVRLPPKTRTVAPPEAVVVAPRPAPKPVPVVEPQPVDAAASVRVASTATVELAPGVLGTTESIKAVPAASSAFRTFVASAKVSGVFQGSPPKAFINGRMVRTGEMVDDALEIYFDSVDLPTRSIVFKDSTGATVSRRY